MTIMSEHKGLVAVHNVCTHMNAIWRPTISTDIGIDGQIEFLNEGECVSTGIILAVQIKSGASYFDDKGNEREVRFYPKEKHRQYWKSINLPVILVLHHPDRQETYYARVKPQLSNSGPIIIKKENVFCSTERQKLLAIGENDLFYLEPQKILEHFEKIKLHRPEGATLTGIEFLAAFTNISEEFFHIRFVRLHTLLEMVNSTGWVSWGTDDYDYMHRCIFAMSAFRLTDSFHEEFYEWWYDIKMVPDIVVPLKSIGIEVVKYLIANQKDYFKPSFYDKLPYLI